MLSTILLMIKDRSLINTQLLKFTKQLILSIVHKLFASTLIRSIYFTLITLLQFCVIFYKTIDVNLIKFILESFIVGLFVSIINLDKLLLKV